MAQAWINMILSYQKLKILIKKSKLFLIVNFYSDKKINTLIKLKDVIQRIYREFHKFQLLKFG